MEWSKIKNIVLIILLLVNGFLLVSVAGQEMKSAQYQRETRQGAVAVLREGGITMDEDALPKGEPRLQPLSLVRDQAGEQKIAETLLGAVERTDEGGRVSYTGPGGEGWFRSNGEFGFALEPGSQSAAGADPTQHIIALLAQGGITTMAVPNVAAAAEGQTLVTLRQTLGDRPIFSANIVAVYEGEALVSVQKQRAAVAMSAGKGGQPLDVATVLIRFYGGIRSGGHVCSTVKRLTPGYWASAEPNGTSTLGLVWQIVTDAGTFYVDGMTGDMTAG
ncbi:MAG: hypothetical protein RRY65_03215 [Pseudoflavonifractor sp.]